MPLASSSEPPAGPSRGAGFGLPFVLDPTSVTEDVKYDGPLLSLQGREAYLEAMGSWRENMPKRLEYFKTTDMNVWSLGPGELTARWTCEFVAPLPPTARLRGLPKGMVVLPGDRAAVFAGMRATLELDPEGRIRSHREEIVAGFGVADAIARYELLTARRLDSVDPAQWYWRVLRATTLEELADSTKGLAGQDELEDLFSEMVLRNFAYGLVIGALIVTAVRFLLGGAA